MRRPDETLIFAVETSCDETAAAVVAGGRRILSNVVASQAELHQRFGGVVPEVASRRHVETVMAVVDRALSEAGLQLGDVDAVAVTKGPGLVGALLVGMSVAKGLALSCNLPLVGINHVDAHVHAVFLGREELQPPLLSLTVSGGHTALLYLDSEHRYSVIGSTRDDAAGEALDKVARLLGLGYPGGPALERLARNGDPQAVDFPRAMLDEGYDFSFSGLKTAAINYLHNLKQKGQTPNPADVAASYQEAVFDVLVEKTMRAAAEYEVYQVVLAGGVAANQMLREKFSARACCAGYEVFWPEPSFCTDNAAMVAAAGYFRYIRGQRDDMDLEVTPSLRLPK